MEFVQPSGAASTARGKRDVSSGGHHPARPRGVERLLLQRLPVPPETGIRVVCVCRKAPEGLLSGIFGPNRRTRSTAGADS